MKRNDGVNKYKIFVNEKVYFELKASFFQTEENTVVFISRKEESMGIYNDKAIAIIPIDKLYIIIDTEFEIIE